MLALTETLQRGNRKTMLIEADRCQLLVVDVQDRLADVMSDRAELLRNCTILLRAAREIGVPIVCSEQYPKGLGHIVPELASLMQPDEQVEKIEFSCFKNPAVRNRLGRSTGRNQLVVTGIEAHVCVLQTAFDAIEDGHHVFVVADAIDSRRQKDKEIALRRLAGGALSIVTTEMVVFEWLRTAAAPAFKPLSKLIR